MAPFLFITANVGSIFQDPKGLLKLWVAEFLKTVDRLKPNFIALHCQEFGGKNYKKNPDCVDDFVRLLLSSDAMLDFESARIFLDEDFTSNDKFTALGSLYFVRKTAETFIWNFDTNRFEPTAGKEIHSGNIDSVATKYKVKFPQEFFTECRWSRKGFMLTRWLINGTSFDTVNIHLFHDESNFVSISEFPSYYALNRRKALAYTLEMIRNSRPSAATESPLFMFGDFNFRLDTGQVVQRLTVNCKASKVQSKSGDLIRVIYHDPATERTLSIERKQFFYSDQNFFSDKKNREWLAQQDKEPHFFEGQLVEMERKFPPSYPYQENVSCSPWMYMNTRCPSWCDRVLMNNAAKRLLLDANHPTGIKYELMGMDASMGDHKPVYLSFTALPSSQSGHSPVPSSQSGRLSATIKRYFYYEPSPSSISSSRSVSGVRVALIKETPI